MVIDTFDLVEEYFDHEWWQILLVKSQEHMNVQEDQQI